jgi:hypothetical protein
MTRLYVLQPHEYSELIIQETFTKRLKAYYESTAPLLKVCTHASNDQADEQYFSDHYPDSLFSLTGSTSDEVHQSPSSSSGHKAQGHASSPPSTTSHISPRITTPSMTYIPDLEMDNNDNAKNAVDQLWPKLQQLIEPFGLHRDKELGDKDKGIEHVRKDADDLRDPEEDVHQAQEDKKKKQK